MDKEEFYKLIEEFIADSKVENRTHIRSIFYDLEKKAEDYTIHVSPRVIERVEEQLLNDAVNDVNKGLDKQIYGFAYMLKRTCELHAVITELQNAVNECDYKKLKKDSENAVEDALLVELQNSIVKKIIGAASMDGSKINEDELYIEVKQSVEKAYRNICSSTIEYSFDKFVDSAKKMVNFNVKKKEESNSDRFYSTDDIRKMTDNSPSMNTQNKDTREFYDVSDIVNQVSKIKPNLDDIRLSVEKTNYDVKENEGFGFPVRSKVELDELGLPVKKPQKDELGVSVKEDNHYNELYPERIKKGTYVLGKEVPRDVEEIDLTDDSCLLISINDMKTIYYYEKDMNDKCVVVEDPSDYVAAAEKIMSTDFYARYKKSADLDQSLKPIFGRLEKELNKQKYRKGLRELVGEKDYPKVLAQLEEEETRFDNSDNAKAFL